MAKGDALTPAQVKELQKKMPSSSPYLPGKSPYTNNKKAKLSVNNVNA